MNKDKLVRIIAKDLEELRILTEEVNELTTDSVLVIDLALGRARLICQEFELLRKVAVQTVPVNEQNDEEIREEFTEEDSDVLYSGFSDPEFEIVDFDTYESEAPVEAEAEIQQPFADEPEKEVEVELPEAEHEDYSIDEDENETAELDYAEPELEITTFDGQVTDENEELAEEEIIVYNADEDEEDEDEDEDEELDEDLIELDEAVPELEPEEEYIHEKELAEKSEEAEPEQKKDKQQAYELKQEPKTTVREIHLEDLDDEDDEPIQFAPRAGTTARPVMHEIPKPEEPVPEKLVVGEKFGTERSVNDVMSENKSAETNIGNGPISSLRAAIGLNDRFLFIREIFGNNTDKYNMVIEQLDKLETIQQAVEYLKANITLQKNNTSMKFVDLLKRRFSH